MGVPAARPSRYLGKVNAWPRLRPAGCRSNTVRSKSALARCSAMCAPSAASTGWLSGWPACAAQEAARIPRGIRSRASRPGEAGERRDAVIPEKLPLVIADHDRDVRACPGKLGCQGLDRLLATLVLALPDLARELLFDGRI